jgi:AAA+ superfamily predicted ATPase
MADIARTTWLEMNQRHLTAGIAYVRALLERHIARLREQEADDQPVDAARQKMEAIAGAMSAPPMLERIRADFGLSPFERDVLLLCAAADANAKVAALCATAHGEPQRVNPTFSLALAALPDPHWSALTPSAPLRRARLIEVTNGATLTLSPLKVDERILHALTGVHYLDPRLAPAVTPLGDQAPLAPSHAEIARQIVASWRTAPSGAHAPCLQLTGADPASKRAIVAAACAETGLLCHVMPADALPAAQDLETTVLLWEREMTLSMRLLLLDCEELDAGTDAARLAAVAQFAARLHAPLIVACREPLRLPHRPALTLPVPTPDAGEQRDVWRAALGGAINLNGHLGALVSQFNLSPVAIRSVTGRVRAQLHDDAKDAAHLLWEACRLEARGRLDDLAQRIESAATWDDLVLPEAQRDTLREIAVHVRQRARVYHDWGFAGKGARGLGISALFAGSSGTGKTMAAEVLANELRLDLYRIDLSSVVSKYIGETEKNLRRVFDAAEAGGAILLFDEADALFGKRSEVKDSHDRYANIEVGYLLQRMEAYRGLAILTTNLRSALDTAFLRRLRFVVNFPFPDAEQRAEIWRRIFPAATPTEGLRAESLARLNVAGGNIRNIALHAAFLAAEENAPVRAAHIVHAARTEYTKLEKPLTDAEIGDWHDRDTEDTPRAHRVAGARGL